MNDGTVTTASAIDRWADLPTSKQRFAVQHAVAQLLDTLAPERPPARRVDPIASLQRIRSPKGCILQADACAVTVSWFAAGPTDGTLGELRLIAWRGVVSRPGAARRAIGGAVSTDEQVFLPVPEGDRWVWRRADGATYDVHALVAHCHELLLANAPADAVAPERRAG